MATLHPYQLNGEDPMDENIRQLETTLYEELEDVRKRFKGTARQLKFVNQCLAAQQERIDALESQIDEMRYALRKPDTQQPGASDSEPVAGKGKRNRLLPAGSTSPGTP